MKNLFFFLGVLVAVASFPSCKSTFPFGKEWELAQLNDEQVPAGTRIMIVFDEANKRYNGTASCNNYNGIYKLDGGSIRFAQPVATKKMCPDMSWENKYLPVLTKIDAWIQSDNQLKFLSKGNVVAIFK